MLIDMQLLNQLDLLDCDYCTFHRWSEERKNIDMDMTNASINN